MGGCEMEVGKRKRRKARGRVGVRGGMVERRMEGWG